MVVGTHLDTIPGPQRPETIERLKSLFAREYLNQTQETMSLRVDPHLRLVNTLESANVQSVRDAIYDCALSYCPSLSRSEYWRSWRGGGRGRHRDVLCWHAVQTHIHNVVSFRCSACCTNVVDDVHLT